MFSVKQKRNPQAVWVALALQPSILWTHECRFCFRNAAHNDLRKPTPFRGGPWGFETMFDDQSFRSANGIHDNEPTRPDAEVQVRERIAPELILGVGIFHRDIEDLVRAILKRPPYVERFVEFLEP
jgi:hypothetical protein